MFSAFKGYGLFFFNLFFVFYPATIEMKMWKNFEALPCGSSIVLKVGGQVVCECWYRPPCFFYVPKMKKPRKIKWLMQGCKSKYEFKERDLILHVENKRLCLLFLRPSTLENLSALSLWNVYQSF